MRDAAPPASALVVTGKAAPEPTKAITVQVPDAYVGTYVVESNDAFVVFEVGARGVVSSRELGDHGEGVTHMALSPDGNVLVYSVHSQRQQSSGALYAVPLRGGEARQVASCPFACRLGGVAADGTIWFVNVESTSKLGPVSRVPLTGGDVAAWPATFADCALDMAVSPDGRELVVAASNGLGWPACIEQGHQGFYHVLLDGSADRDVKPKRFGCFTPETPAKINVTVEHIEVREKKRLLVTAMDHWAKPAHDPALPTPTWACDVGSNRGSRADHELVLRSAKLDGKHWVMAVRADTLAYGDDPNTKKIPLAGPLDHVGEFAFRTTER